MTDPPLENARQEPRESTGDSKSVWAVVGDSSRVAAVGIALIYAIGVLIVHTNLSQYGIEYGLDLARPQYVLVGALWASVVALPLAVSIVVTSWLWSLQNAYLPRSVTRCLAILFIVIFYLVWPLGLLWGIWGWGLATNHTSTLAIVALDLNVAIVGIALWLFRSSVSVSPPIPTPRGNPSRHSQDYVPLKVAVVFVLSFLALFLYAIYCYPMIPPGIGGGRRGLVKVILKAPLFISSHLDLDMTTDGRTFGPVDWLYETDKTIIVGLDAARNMSFLVPPVPAAFALDKDLVEAVVYVPKQVGLSEGMSQSTAVSGKLMSSGPIPIVPDHLDDHAGTPAHTVDCSSPSWFSFIYSAPPLPEGLDWLCRRANAGKTKAQYDLGLFCYSKGAELVKAQPLVNFGVEHPNADKEKQDYYHQAIKWYTKAAEHGNAPAQNNLGTMYANGDGVERDNAEALKWYLKAAANKGCGEAGCAEAEYNLGVMYSIGQGVNQDYNQAVYWFTQAGNQGNVEAQYNLGLLYATGSSSVQADYTKALEWYRKVADRKDTVTGAEKWLDSIHAKDPGMKPDDTKSFEWYQKVADQNTADQKEAVNQAHRQLDSLYANAPGVNSDTTSKALDWYKKAAEQSDPKQRDPEAEYGLGLMYYRGEVEKDAGPDYAEALKWYRKAADDGSVEARANLGLMYYFGQGRPAPDCGEAFDSLHRAAEQGDEIARTMIDKLAWSGPECERGEREANEKATSVSAGQKISH